MNELREGIMTLKQRNSSFQKKTILMLFSFIFTRQLRNIKGYLICNGWKLKKIHDIETLITEAAKFDAEFQEYLDFSRELTALL